MIICSKFVCSKNLLDTILLLLDTVRAIIFILVNCSTTAKNLLSCRINWIRAINYFCVNCSNCRPIYIRTVDTVKTDINFARIAITIIANDCRAIEFRPVHPHSTDRMSTFVTEAKAAKLREHVTLHFDRGGLRPFTTPDNV
jgi:hypothetical protein